MVIPDILQFTGQYRWLSNFWRVPILIDEITYPSVEHAYMSHKSDDPQWKQRCADPKISPAEIKKESRTIPLKEGWDDMRLEVMEKCLRIKFSQEPFKSKLLATNGATIIEGNHWGDTFWGMCNSTGTNHLGRLIMEIRMELRGRTKR